MGWMMDPIISEVTIFIDASARTEDENESSNLKRGKGVLIFVSEEL